ncbi:hypothetical protein ACU4GD_15965 [Cupriavidus basilensis]
MSDRQRCQNRHQRAGIALPRQLAALALAASATLGMGVAQAQGQAQPQDADEGIRVQRGRASIRQIVPVEVIEQQASQEYEQIKGKRRPRRRWSATTIRSCSACAPSPGASCRRPRAGTSARSNGSGRST